MTCNWDDQIERAAASFLDARRTASLATVGADGRPHAANIQYVRDGRGDLYFISDPKSVHGCDMSLSRDVALTVYAHDDRMENIHGVQIHGVVQRLDESERWGEAWDRYVAKYPAAAQEPLCSMIRSLAFYSIQPTWIRWIDNRREFGFKVEKDLAR